MIYIIQTNTSIDNKGKSKDFQSMMFSYDDWDTYKDDLLNNKSTGKVIDGTLWGCLKPRNSIITDIIINDDFHLECILYNGFFTINVKAYKVECENVDYLISKEK